MSELKLYTTNEVAEMLKKTRRTVYKYIKSGELEVIKLGNEYRVTESALMAFLDGRKEVKA